MEPSRAGFDGTNGIRIASGQIYKLKRGSTVPDPEVANLKNQLLWFSPEGKDPKLLYCNDENQLFELDFIFTEPWLLLLAE